MFQLLPKTLDSARTIVYRYVFGSGGEPPLTPPLVVLR
ncbi:hypothetical protein A2U01_0100127, partial [Trifolium medium]|nr:hypothetical protein [Trifolium medium]